MTGSIRVSTGAALMAAVLVLAGCPADDADRPPAGTDPGVDPGADARAEPQPQPPPDLRLEVDLDARELYVYRGDERVATHGVAVGSEEWPTRTGEFRIGQVVWNPRWVPPEEEWAEDREIKEPGDPENPLGRAQLVYDPPRSVHGTNEPGSIGQAVTHGSLRVTDEVAMELARMVMEAGGADRDESWYQQARENRDQRQDVPIPNPVPIRIRGDAGAERTVADG
jgi:lipoprotein-anchoring transpeptidase ErfK/SrfK